MSEVAIILAVISVPVIITLIADKFELFELNNIPIAKYILYFIAGWFTVPILGIACKINETNNYGLTYSLGGVYKAMFVIMTLLTAFMLLGFLVYMFRWMGELAK